MAVRVDASPALLVPGLAMVAVTVAVWALSTGVPARTDPIQPPIRGLQLGEVERQEEGEEGKEGLEEQEQRQGWAEWRAASRAVPFKSGPCLPRVTAPGKGRWGSDC